MGFFFDRCNSRLDTVPFAESGLECWVKMRWTFSFWLKRNFRAFLPGKWISFVPVQTVWHFELLIQSQFWLCLAISCRKLSPTLFRETSWSFTLVPFCLFSYRLTSSSWPHSLRFLFWLAIFLLKLVLRVIVFRVWIYFTDTTVCRSCYKSCYFWSFDFIPIMFYACLSCNTLLALLLTLFLD